MAEAAPIALEKLRYEPWVAQLVASGVTLRAGTERGQEDV